MQLSNGTYAAHPAGASVYKNQKGSLVLSVAFKLDADPSVELKGFFQIVGPDGEAKTGNIESLKEWSGWSDMNPFWFMRTDLTQIPVELVVENRPGIKHPDQLYPSVKYVNKPGSAHSGGSELHEAADEASIMAQFGSVLRAAGAAVPKAVSVPQAVPAARPTSTVPTVRPIAAPTPPPTTPPAAPAPAVKAAPVAATAGATLDAFWPYFLEATKTVSETERNRIWIDCQTRHAHGKAPDLMTYVEATEMIDDLCKTYSITDFMPF